MISLIVAHDEQLGIGLDNKIPWNSPEDMHWFKEHTVGKTVVMGRKTYESIGKPLKNRKNIVVSRTSSTIDGCDIVRTLDGISKLTDDEIVIIGGSEIYNYAIDNLIINKLYITVRPNSYECDAWFRYPDMEKYELSYERRTIENIFRIYDRIVN